VDSRAAWILPSFLKIHKIGILVALRENLWGNGQRGKKTLPVLSTGCLARSMNETFHVPQYTQWPAMENRREYYRHAFPPTRGMTVLLSTTDGTSSFMGDMVNLSIGGLCARPQAKETAAGKKWIASIALEPEVTLHIPVEEVHDRDDQGGYCGFRFLPRPNPRVQEEQERKISSFLLDEQRGQRRQERALRRAGG
jgi:hypothetical protein